MKVDVYHLPPGAMNVKSIIDGYKIISEGREFTMPRPHACLCYYGYLYVDGPLYSEGEAEKVFNLCNWGEWSSEKPPGYYAEMVSTGSGLVLKDEVYNCWLCLPVGWRKFNDLSTILKEYACYMLFYKISEA